MKGKAALIVGVALALVLGMVFLQPVVSAANDNTGTQTVTNESVTANVGTFVDLGGYSLADGSETVYMLNDTSGEYEVATSGTDYEMSYNDGAIKALETSTHIDDGENVKVSYDYQASDGLTETVGTFVPVMLATLLLVVAANGVRKEMM